MIQNIEQLVPLELLEFLNKGEQLNYDPVSSEVGKVTLKNQNQLNYLDIYIDSEGSPNQEKKGYYIGRSIDLLASAEGFSPGGILVWLPDYKSFGSWDSDHWKLIVFDKTHWNDIVANPTKYLNSQWDPNLGGGKYLEPWYTWEFKEGRPF